MCGCGKDICEDLNSNKLCALVFVKALRSEKCGRAQVFRKGITSWLGSARFQGHSCKAGTNNALIKPRDDNDLIRSVSRTGGL